MGRKPLGHDGSPGGPPRGALIHAQKTGNHREAARIRNGSEDPVWHHKCWCRSRREMTPDTVAPGTVRMSLTGTVPDIFSASSRKVLRTNIPERFGVNISSARKPEGLNWLPEGLNRYLECMGTWHGPLDRIHRTIPASGTNVGGMTPGMPKACQTGWFEPSRYRFKGYSG